MLRFISHNLTDIDGIAIYPILSLLMFTTFFAFVITYVVRMRKSHVEEVSNIPLEDDDYTGFTDSLNS